jgi:hypothetical protein
MRDSGNGGNHDVDFAGRLAESPGVTELVAQALREEDGSADPYLRARRLIEDELRARPDEIPEWDFRRAAGQLRASGLRAESNVLARIADTSGLLAEVSQDWHGRYLGRPPTVDEENDARRLNTGQVTILDRAQAPGCDGALYVSARLEVPGGACPLAVVITTDAGAEEVVTGFRHEYEHQAWRSDRGLSNRASERAEPCDGPLDSAVTGPWCRAAREELVLAFLMRGGALGFGIDDAGSGTGRLQTHTFSTYSRSECFTAVRTAGLLARGNGDELTPDVALRELERRLLRAPGWAADQIGWPFGRLALAYARRLAATPVTREEARASARKLLLDDTVAANNAHTRWPSQRATWQLSRQPGLVDGLDGRRSGRRGSRASRVPRPRRPGDPPPPGPASRI